MNRLEWIMAGGGKQICEDGIFDAGTLIIRIKIRKEGIRKFFLIDGSLCDIKDGDEGILDLVCFVSYRTHGAVLLHVFLFGDK